MQYLLIARFSSMDDIPLRLYDNRAMAEEAARAIDADPTLLRTKWARSVDKWPWLPEGFVGSIVLSIAERDGYPREVTFDSTSPAESSPAESSPAESSPAESSPAAPAPPEPTHPPVPEGYIEITDPDHKLRSHVDFFLSSCITPDEWVPITESDAVRIGEWSERGYRFCCPADKHPDLQGKPAETPTREQLQAVVRSLEQSNSDLRAEFEQWRAHADTRIGELTTENSNLHAQLREQLTENSNLHAQLRGQLTENNTLVATRTQLHKTISEMLEERSQWIETHVPELQGRYDKCKERIADLEAQNSDLRRLNEDLNNRLSKTLARAALATHLESSVRASGIQMLRFSVAMGDRRRWATTFVEEGVLAKQYLQAIERIDEQFTELFSEFVARFPHIQPDLPDEWQMGNGDDDDDLNNGE